METQIDYEEYYEKLKKTTEIHIKNYINIEKLITEYNEIIKKYNIENINYKDIEQQYKIKLSLEQSTQISYDFFESLGLLQHYLEILNGKDGIEVNIGKDKKGNNISYSYFQIPYDTDEFILNIRDHHTLETVFRICHEITHAITTQNRKLNQTTYTLREVPSIIIEILLYDYLLENHEKYNLNKEDLLNDINLNRLERLLSYKDENNRCFRNDYFIAILISNQLRKKTEQQKIKITLEFLEYIKQDKLEEALKSLQLNNTTYLVDLEQEYIETLKIISKEKTKNI